MTRRVPALLAVPVLAAALAGGCADEAAAARVGDTTISNDDLMSEVKAIHDNDALWEQADRSQIEGEAKGSYAQQFVGSILQTQVQYALIDQLFEQEGGKLTDSDRADAEDSLINDQFGQAFKDFPKAYRDKSIDDTAKLAWLQDELGGDFGEAFNEIKADTEIEISSRYGSLDEVLFENANDQLAIVPPVGPVQAGGESDSTTVPGDL